MNTETFVDVEGPVRAWVRTLNLPHVSTRVFLGLPERCTFPALDMQLMDGGTQGTSEAPLANPLFTFSVWGTKQQRVDIAQTAWALCSAIRTLRYTTVDGLVLLGGQIVLGPLPRWDPDGTPRYQLDASLALRVAQ